MRLLLFGEQHSDELAAVEIVDSAERHLRLPANLVEGSNYFEVGSHGVLAPSWVALPRLRGSGDFSLFWKQPKQLVKTNLFPKLLPNAFAQ